MRTLLKHPKFIIILNVLITIALAIPLKNIKLENSIRDFFPLKHEAYQRLTETEEQFGSMIAIGISLETRRDSIMEEKTLDVIRKITAELEGVENTSDVVSITNIDYISNTDDGIKVAPLLDKGNLEPVTKQDSLTLRERLVNWWRMYDGVIINDNEKGTQISLSVDPNVPSSAQTKALDEVREIVLRNIAGTDLKMKLYGEPVISQDSRQFMLTDLAILIPLVVLVVLISLNASFVTLDGTLLPLLTVLMSTVWSCGLMALLGITFSLVSSVIPVALIACGSAYGIHVMTHYYIAVDDIKRRCAREGREFEKKDHIDAICEGFSNVFLAVMLSALTTVIGFASLVTSPIRPLFSFAIFTALGIAFSLWLSMSIIPAILSLKNLNTIGKRTKLMEKLIDHAKNRLENRRKKSGRDSQDASSTLYAIYSFFCGTTPRLIVSSLVIIALSIFGLLKLDIDTALVNYFPETSRLRQDLNYVNDNFAGTNSVYLLFKSPASTAKSKSAALYKEAAELKEKAEKDGKEVDAATQEKINNLLEEAGKLALDALTLPNMTNTEALHQIDVMEKWLTDNYKIVGKAVSYTDSIKKINQVWNAPMLRAQDDIVAASESQTDTFGDFDFSEGENATDFGFENDFGFPEEFSETEKTNTPSYLTDPNEAYRNMLNKSVTTNDVLKLFYDSYVHDLYDGNLDTYIEALQIETNYNGMAFYEIPTDPAKYMHDSPEDLAAIVSNYTLLLGDGMKRFIDDIVNYNPTVVRMQVQIHTHSTSLVGKMLKDVEEYAKNNLPEGYYMEATGQGEMEYVMTNLVVSSQLSSLLLSLALVIVIIAISFRSLLAGFIGAIPLAFTIILNYMVMGIFGIKLDLITSIIASVAIGVGIDYTIHFMTEFRALRQESNDLKEVTKGTFKSSGMGIITNALAVGLGFLVLCLSRFVVLRYIGILVAIVMFTSSVLSMTIIPGIFNVIDPNFLHKGKPKAWEEEDPQKVANRRLITYIREMAHIDAIQRKVGMAIEIPVEVISAIKAKLGGDIPDEELHETYEQALSDRD